MLITFLAVHFSLFYLLWTSSAFFTFKCEQLVWSIFRFGTFNRFPICYCLLQCPIDVLQADTVAQAFSFTCFIEPLVFHLRLESIEMASHIEISLSLSLVSNKLLITSRDISFSLSLSLSLSVLVCCEWPLLFLSLIFSRNLHYIKSNFFPPSPHTRTRTISNKCEQIGQFCHLGYFSSIW